MNKFFSWLLNIFIIILIVITILSVIGSKMDFNSSIVRYIPMQVLSGSMEPEIKVGDIVVSKAVDSSSIKEGDVITYKMGANTLVTHRVIEIIEMNGSNFYKTRGDANNVEDSDLVSRDNVVGKLALRIPRGGYVVDILTSPIGFVIFFVLPIVVLIGNGIKSIRSKSTS